MHAEAQDRTLEMLRSEPGVEALARVHARLTTAAEAEGLLDVAYRRLDSALGPLLLAATDIGLVRLAFANEDHAAVLGTLATTISPRVLHAPKRLDLVVRQLEEYLEGGRRNFEVPLDFRLSKGFRRQVLSCLVDITYGATKSYREIALAAGSPRAVRAVGSACATNPLPLVVPCHRVVRSDGSIGQYAGGAEVKVKLLQLERDGARLI